jgi:hypothetical protein
MSRPTQHAQRKHNAEQIAEEAYQAYQLRLQGQPFRAIAATMKLAVSTVHDRVNAYASGHVDPLADQYRQVELDRMDGLAVKAYEVLGREHIVAQQGKIVRDDEGTPLLDSAPILSAIGTLVRISERRAKLLGLDAAVKVDAQVHTVDPADIELAQMIREAKAKAAVTEAALKGEAQPNG